MVPLAYNTLDPLLPDVYRALTEQAKATDVDGVDGAFMAWISNCIVDSSLPSLPADLTVTNYHHVAKLAFLREINPLEFNKYEDFLIDGLNRVAGRSITLLGTEPAPFCQDAVALLGLALGAKWVGGDLQAKVRQWMQSFIYLNDKTTIAWKRIFYFVTLKVVGGTGDERDLQDLKEISDIKLAFTARIENIFSDIALDAAYREIYKNAMTQDKQSPLAACRLAALYHLSQNTPVISINRPTVQQVINLLDMLPSGLKRWPWEEKPKTSTGTAQKWDIQNEYHVQSLVYSLLAPIFPDIEDEFYLDRIGQLNPRADIGLPSLHLIIEIKFLRSSTSFQTMIEEIASDVSLYFREDSVFAKKYSQMLVVLWDNSSRNQHHHEFKKGISKLSRIVGSVVVSRPGNMISNDMALKKTNGVKKGK